MRMMYVYGRRQREKKEPRRRVTNTNEYVICIKRSKYSINQMKELNDYFLKGLNLILNLVELVDSLYA